MNIKDREVFKITMHSSNGVDYQADYSVMFLRPPRPPQRKMGGFRSGSISSSAPCSSGG
jgi:hypothetical protein